MNTELRKKAKNDFGKDFCQLMTNSVLERLWKMSQNTKISSLKQPKEEGIIWNQNQSIIQEKAFQNINQQQK